MTNHLMTRLLAAVHVLSLLVAFLAPATDAQNGPFTLKFVQARAEKNCTVDFVRGPAFTATAGGATANMNLARMTLAPCATRNLHMHRDVDEMVTVLSGMLYTTTVLPNGTVIGDIVDPGYTFVLPKGQVHNSINPSCNESATFLLFFNSFDLMAISVARDVLLFPDNPLLVYSEDVNSTVAASTYFSYDPVCLRDCNLGPKYGQQPAPPAPNAAHHRRRSHA